MFGYNLPSKKISDKKLAIIKNPVKRLRYLLKKYSDNELYKLNKEQLLGLISMVEGLVYHHKKFCRAEDCSRRNTIEFIKSRNKSLSISFGETSYDNRHEFCAYTNVLGQIFYLFTSRELKDICLPIKTDSEKKIKEARELFFEEYTPIFWKYLFVRNKYSAHRKNDYPRGDKSKDLGMNNYGLMFCLTGKSSSIEGKSDEFPSNGKSTMYFPDKDNRPVEYCLSEDHDKIIKEIEYLFKCLF